MTFRVEFGTFDGRGWFATINHHDFHTFLLALQRGEFFKDERDFWINPAQLTFVREVPEP